MELMIEKLLGFVMVMTRLSAFFLAAPIFSTKTIPVRIRVAVVLLISIFFTATNAPSINTAEISWLQAILLICNEAIYGLAMGLILVLVFSAVKVSGRIIERQMGMAMAQTVDPLSGERTQPLGSLLEILFILLFLAANGHHLLLLVISRSYQAFPAGTIPTISVLTEGVTKAGSTMLIAGLQLAAPMLAVFLMFLVILAVLARIMPNMNILFISFPLRIGLGLLMIVIFIPFISGFVTEFADWMGKLLPL